MSLRLVEITKEGGRRVQKKGVLSESALPEELRLALAQNMQNDMFHQVSQPRGSPWLRTPGSV
jgi:uncharacterized protein YdeI (YjbR/CyaY-like superfamily)